MKITVHGQPVELTKETILATRQYYIDNARICIDDAISGKQTVNDLAKYINWQNDRIYNLIEGKSDHTFTFIQMAYYIQSGECVPLLN